MATPSLYPNGIEHYDAFGDAIIFYCNIDSGSVSDELIKQAKEIDKENYSPNCFGVCVNFSDDGFCVVEDKPLYEIYYIDNVGNKNYLAYSLSDEEKEMFFSECRREILQRMMDV